MKRVRAWSSLACLAFVVLVVAGSAMLFDGPTDESPAKMTAWYRSSSHRDGIHIGWVLAGLGLFCLLWFVAAVRERIAESVPADGSMLATVVTIGGAAFAAVAMCVIGIADGVKTMSDDTYRHQVYSGVVHAANDAAYVMLVSGGAAMAATIFAISIAALAYGILPRWVGWFGVAAGIAALFSLFFFTMLVWLLWIAVASVALFVRGRRAEAPAGAAQPSAAV